MSRSRDRVKRARRAAWVLHKRLCDQDPQRASLSWEQCKRCSGTGRVQLKYVDTSRKAKGYKFATCQYCWGEVRR